MSQSDQVDPLRTVAEVAAIANYFQIGSINNRIQEIEHSVSQSAINEERQTNIRQVVFQFNNFITKESDGIKDKLVVATALVAIKTILSKSGINSSSFVQISDKQFFQETLLLLNSKMVEVQSYEPEAAVIENAYRQFKAFSKIAKISSSVIELINKKNNPIRNPIVGFIIGFIIVVLFCLLFDPNNPDNGINFWGIIIMGSLLGTLFASFSHLMSTGNTQMLEYSLIPVMPYIVMADLKLDADNLIPTLNNSSQKAQKIEVKINEYENKHPELKLIRQLL
jgi:hypothetical protein